MIYSNSSSIFSTLCCCCCCFWFFALFCFVKVVQPLPKIDCNVGLVNYAFMPIREFRGFVLFGFFSLYWLFYFLFIRLYLTFYNFFFSNRFKIFLLSWSLKHLTEFLDLFAMLKLILSNLDLVGPSKFDSHLNALRVKWLKVTTFGSLRFFGS